jgi:hypothetical protein
MTKVRRTLLVAVPVAVVVLLVTLLVAYAAKRRDQGGRIQAMRSEADLLIIEKKYAEASDRLEGLQMLLMKERRFEDALKVSFEIEEVAAKASGRRSPWHYVRIGEVHLAMGHTDQYFEWVEKAIREGKKGTMMASFEKQLSAEEVKGLVGYIRKLGGVKK